MFDIMISGSKMNMNTRLKIPMSQLKSMAL